MFIHQQKQNGINLNNNNFYRSFWNMVLGTSRSIAELKDHL